MYAISQVNEGKYRVLSDSLNSAFRNVPGDTSGAQVAINPNNPVPFQIQARKPVNLKSEEQRKQKEKMRNAASEIRQALAPLVQAGQVRIFEGARGITIEINANVLFSPGEARLDIAALRALSDVAKILAPTAFPLTVEGHTDSLPIATAQFPSNWELSGARASSVVRLFIDNGVDARRLTATGLADQRPVADNALPDGRARNRRVAITMESQTPDTQVEAPLPATN
jgi:chemotaxis protein MotB